MSSWKFSIKTSFQWKIGFSTKWFFGGEKYLLFTDFFIEKQSLKSKIFQFWTATAVSQGSCSLGVLCSHFLLQAGLPTWTLSSMMHHGHDTPMMHHLTKRGDGCITVHILWWESLTERCQTYNPGDLFCNPEHHQPQCRLCIWVRTLTHTRCFQPMSLSSAVQETASKVEREAHVSCSIQSLACARNAIHWYWRCMTILLWYGHRLLSAVCYFTVIQCRQLCIFCSFLNIQD